MQLTTRLYERWGTGYQAQSDLVKLPPDLMYRILETLPFVRRIGFKELMSEENAPGMLQIGKEDQLTILEVANLLNRNRQEGVENLLINYKLCSLKEYKNLKCLRDSLSLYPNLKKSF